MFDFLKSPSEKVQAEITAEQQRSVQADAEEAKLRIARDDALLAGDTKSVDAIDAQIATIGRDAQRRRERVTLLTTQLQKAQDREHDASLDAVAARTNKARELGESLLRKDYAKHAAALADVLIKLDALDVFIDSQNRILDRAGREQVHSPNAIRTKPGWTETITTRRLVGIHEEMHPHFGKEAEGLMRYEESVKAKDQKAKLVDGTFVPRFVELDVEQQISHMPDWKYPVHQAIKLIPNAGTDHTPLYDKDARDRHERVNRVLIELGV